MFGLILCVGAFTLQVKIFAILFCSGKIATKKFFFFAICLFVPPETQQISTVLIQLNLFLNLLFRHSVLVLLETFAI